MPRDNGTERECRQRKAPPEGDEDLHKYMYLFIFAQVMMGIGMSPKFVLGPTYVDENVSQKRSPKLLGQF